MLAVAAIAAPLVNHIFHVLLAGGCEQVVGVHAEAVIAGVANVVTIRDVLGHEEDVTETVRAHAAAVANVTVAVSLSRTPPFPARERVKAMRIHLLKEGCVFVDGKGAVLDAHLYSAACLAGPFSIAKIQLAISTLSSPPFFVSVARAPPPSGLTHHPGRSRKHWRNSG